MEPTPIDPNSFIFVFHPSCTYSLSSFFTPHFLLLNLHLAAEKLESDKLKVRLVNQKGTINRSFGRLEVLHKGAWTTVCKKYIDNLDASLLAQVVCRMLGSESKKAKAVYAPQRGAALKAENITPGTGPISLDFFMCKGTEKSIFDCGPTCVECKACEHTDDFGIKCF